MSPVSEPTPVVRLEQRATALLQSPVVRRIGFVLGVGALVFLVLRLLRAGDDAVEVMRSIGVGGLLVAVVAWVAWQSCAVVAATAVGLPMAWRVWANAQLLKYIPVPASAVAGFVGSAVQQGQQARSAAVLMIRHTGVLVLGAAAVGTWAVAEEVARRNLAPRAVVLILALVTIAGASFLLRRVLSPRAVLVSAAAWAGAGLVIGYALGGSDGLVVGSAFAGSWVAGQIVIPVPAGAGVRELAFVALVEPTVGADRALVIALAARLVTTVGDVAFSLGIRAIRRDARDDLS